MRHQRLTRFLFVLPLRLGVFLYAVLTARSEDLNRNSPLHILVSILLFLAPLVEDRTLAVPWLMIYGAEFVYMFPWDCCVGDICGSWNYIRELLLGYGLLVVSSYYLLLKDQEENGPVDLGEHWTPWANAGMEGDVSGSAAANLDVNAEAAADMHAELAAEAEATADAYGYGVGCDELEGAAAVSVASQHRMSQLPPECNPPPIPDYCEELRAKALGMADCGSGMGSQGKRSTAKRASAAQYGSDCLPGSSARKSSRRGSKVGSSRRSSRRTECLDEDLGDEEGYAMEERPADCPPCPPCPPCPGGSGRGSKKSSRCRSKTGSNTRITGSVRGTGTVRVGSGTRSKRSSRGSRGQHEDPCADRGLGGADCPHGYGTQSSDAEQYDHYNGRERPGVTWAVQKHLDYPQFTSPENIRRNAGGQAQQNLVPLNYLQYGFYQQTPPPIYYPSPTWAQAAPAIRQPVKRRESGEATIWRSTCYVLGKGVKLLLGAVAYVLDNAFETAEYQQALYSSPPLSAGGGGGKARKQSAASALQPRVMRAISSN